ncbi:MAG TPA: DinB family protein [Acidobacteriaceae bacterium]|nr:DinB family protein [Acidobacteriaceae bacterium]
MSIAQELLAEFVVQAPVTRKFLERLPEDKLLWKPHAKSMTAGQLAYHLALVPGGVSRGAQQNQVPPPTFQFPQPESVKQVLTSFDEGVATVREVMAGFDDEAMNATWRIVDGERELVAMPRRDFVRNIMLNHWYQHRGQFAVYLRLLDVAVPSSWGPSGDERSAFQE